MVPWRIQNQSGSKKELGINATVQDENWFDYIILWAQFLSLRDIRDLLFSSMSLLIFVIQQMVSLARITMKKS